MKFGIMIPRLIENTLYQRLTSLHKVILFLGTGQIQAFEFKFGGASLGRSADAFKNAYSVDVQLINQDNYLEFILPT